MIAIDADSDGSVRMQVKRPVKRSNPAVPLAGRAPKLRGHRQPVAFTLPPEIVAAVDAVAAEEKRSRANMIEIILGQYLQARGRRSS